jgi:hypothetical protein
MVRRRSNHIKGSRKNKSYRKPHLNRKSKYNKLKNKRFSKKKRNSKKKSKIKMYRGGTETEQEEMDIEMNTDINTENQIISNNSSKLTEIEKNIMFQMYETSYTSGNQELWFKSQEDLFNRYPCFLSFNNNYLIVYAMFQMKNNYNKISLVCHNGSDEGKKLSIKLRLELIKQPGWILEASDKVSWLLRKEKAPIISTHQEIVEALDIKNNPNDIITMNDTFDYNEKMTHQYVRSYTDTINNKTFESPETLFGTLPCTYDDVTCRRICILKHDGGKYKIKKTKSRKKG